MLDLRAIEALSFDCYGTLIDWESGLLPILERWAKRHDSALQGEGLLEAFAETEARIESDHPSMLYPEVLAAVLESMAKQAGIPRDPGAEAELANSVGEWPPFGDTVEALRSLKRRYQLAILSNVHRAGFEKSNRSLGVKFDFVVTAEDVGSYKPKLVNFHALLRRFSELGIEKEHVLHVAQSLYHDHVPAKQLGLSTVWIDRRKGKQGHGATLAPERPVVPDAEYPSLRAFADAVESAFRTTRHA